MKTVFLDVDTQLDFLFPAGALYAPGAEQIVGAIGRLSRFAAAHDIPVISTTDAHMENDPEFKDWPHHCVAGTTGQHKAAASLLERRVTIPNRACAIGAEDAQQIIVEKQTVDVFQAPNLTKVLDLLQAARYVVYGVVTEICVLNAARGLLKRGGRVEVAGDAIAALTPEGSRRAIAEIVAGGGRLTTVDEITSER